ncbi:flagellar motor protein MotB [Seohaeicola nanhaiensis]|uniref:Flagellar motor protein MotB n=1 Tax=Seohaeicola nanhaiensis TaxID=1387282 RepID=A0ABV9KHB4_9RHOB
MRNRPIIIKRIEEEGEHGHHGGGWKVAYADFMTAMMAFFLLLWILAASDEEKLRGLADYFTPSLSEQGGKGDGVLGGQVLAEKGVLSGSEGPKSEVQLPSFGRENPLSVFDSRLKEDTTRTVVEYEPAPLDAAGNGGQDVVSKSGQFDGTTPHDGSTEHDGAGPAQAVSAEVAAAQFERESRLDAIEESILNAIRAKPELADFTANIRFERTTEGLTVQIVDQDGRSMFGSGSSRIETHTREMIEIVGSAIAEMPYPLTISGHTDSVPFQRNAGYSNWELSADRANATRRVLLATGVSPSRVQQIAGLADTKPLLPDRPDAALNRRIDILLAYPDPARQVAR